MKKIFALAAVAVLALASCSNNTIDPVNQKEINFSAVAGKATRAPITSTYFLNGNDHFGVYAYYLGLNNGANKAWATDFADASLYMGTKATGENASAGVEIEYNGTIWAPADTYYWPLQGNLTFFAYWPYDALTNPAFALATKTFSAGSFTVATTVADQVDVLVSSFTADQTQNTTQYNDGTVNSGSTLGVPIQFNHMLSQVVFTAATAEEVFDSGLSFKVDSIIVGARGTSAGLSVVPGSAPTWTDPTALTAYNVRVAQFPNDATTGGVAANWLAKTQSEQIGDALLMIPNSDFYGVDDDEDTAADNEYITVKYTLYRMDDGLNMGSKRVTVELKDYNNIVSNWEAGKKYTYQLTIDLEKIYFAPTVTDWTNAAAQPVDVK